MNNSKFVSLTLELEDRKWIYPLCNSADSRLELLHDTTNEHEHKKYYEQIIEILKDALDEAETMLEIGYEKSNEIVQNARFFKENIADLLLKYNAKSHLLIRHQKIIASFDTENDAYTAAYLLFKDKLFSIHKVVPVL